MHQAITEFEKCARITKKSVLLQGKEIEDAKPEG